MHKNKPTKSHKYAPINFRMSFVLNHSLVLTKGEFEPMYLCKPFTINENYSTPWT